MNIAALSFAASEPYPPVKVEGPNALYAREMLSNIGSCNSETSAISLYLYNSIVARAPHPAIAECFHKISVVEMHHLDIFGQLSLLLGADPRWWYCRQDRLIYWTPRCNQYPRAVRALLDNALHGEEEAIAKYERQAATIGDPCIVALLRRIIADEQVHVEIFHRLLDELPPQSSRY